MYPPLDDPQRDNDYRDHYVSQIKWYRVCRFTAHDLPRRSKRERTDRSESTAVANDHTCLYDFLQLLYVSTHLHARKNHLVVIIVIDVIELQLALVALVTILLRLARVGILLIHFACCHRHRRLVRISETRPCETPLEIYSTRTDKRRCDKWFFDEDTLDLDTNGMLKIWITSVTRLKEKSTNYGPSSIFICHLFLYAIYFACWPAKPKIVIIWPFTEKFAD